MKCLLSFFFFFFFAMSWWNMHLCIQHLELGQHCTAVTTRLNNLQMPNMCCSSFPDDCNRIEFVILFSPLIWGASVWYLYCFFIIDSVFNLHYDTKYVVVLQLALCKVLKDWTCKVVLTCSLTWLVEVQVT